MRSLERLRSGPRSPPPRRSPPSPPGRSPVTETVTRRYRKLRGGEDSARPRPPAKPARNCSLNRTYKGEDGRRYRVAQYEARFSTQQGVRWQTAFRWVPVRSAGSRRVRFHPKVTVLHIYFTR